jgi:hypothetical protein
MKPRFFLLVGIDPATVSPFPSFENQVLQVQEQAMRDSISAELVSSWVSVSRSEQRFSLLDSHLKVMEKRSSHFFSWNT